MGTAAAAKDVAGSSHWKIERVISVALVPLCAAPFVTGGGYTTDMLLAIAVPVHNHMYEFSPYRST